MNNTALEVVNVTPTQMTPMNLLQLAIEKGAGIDTIERLAKLQREMLEYEAKTAYAKAMRRAQESMTRISADANNPQTRSKYASYAQLDRELRPIYGREGFALSFDTGTADQPEHVRVLCDVSHSDGYTKTHHIDMPSDGKGAKGGDVMTKTHATGAAASYGMRYLLKMIFNVAVGEEDRDGNGASAPTGNRLAEPLILERITWIEGANDMAALKRIHTNACKMAQEAGDASAELRFIKATNIRKAALNAQG